MPTQVINLMCLVCQFVSRLIDGDKHSQISRLYDYRLELLRTHPRSTIKFKCDARVILVHVHLSNTTQKRLLGRMQTSDLHWWLLPKGSIWWETLNNSGDRYKWLYLPHYMDNNGQGEQGKLDIVPWTPGRGLADHQQ